MGITVGEILRSLGGGAKALYSHRMRQQDIEREEADRRDARAFRDAQAKQAIEDARENRRLKIAEQEMMKGYYTEQGRHNRALEDQNAAELADRELNTVVNTEAKRGFIPNDPRSYVATNRANSAIDALNANPAPASEEFGIGPIQFNLPQAEQIRPDAAALDAARRKAESVRGNVEIPGYGTAVYDPAHMSGMSTYMGNFNRPGSNESASLRNSRLNRAVDAEVARQIKMLGFDAKFMTTEQKVAIDQYAKMIRAREAEINGFDYDSASDILTDRASGARFRATPAQPPEELVPGLGRYMAQPGNGTQTPTTPGTGVNPNKYDNLFQ